MKWLIALCNTNDKIPSYQMVQYQDIMLACHNKGIKTFCHIYNYKSDDIFAFKTITDFLLKHQEHENFDGIILLESPITSKIVGYFSAHSNFESLYGIHKISWKEQNPIFHKSIYNHNVTAEFEIHNPFIVGINGWHNTNSISHDAILDTIYETIDVKSYTPDFILDRNLQIPKSIQITSPVLLAIGKGVKSKEDVATFRKFAQNNHYMFGVTRPVAMNGWAHINEIIGVSGHIYSPKLCITIGVSGSAAFYAGIEKSNYIISININKNASIIPMSDIGIIDDYRNIWDKFSNYLSSTF